ncbi:DUF58 domain-containing protein [Luteimicrobium subarcticum]|uniref:Uncharacterized protein (DUF58 family) n=1 Tax=Luteimicrobium subarcticum TaxID=620910 RepID=A0A2M8WTJ0_9MICO|nr:DUF58 domain-containing protein [Luteimicrobium subarcticum]PJI94281.1 uncharacterized protein (DUF58 family) [Luteimicrobium subarcticum]
MVVTWRAVVLAAVLGIPVAVAADTAMTLLAVGVLVLVAVVDIALAASPRAVTLERVLPTSVRLTGTATSRLTLVNGSRRRLRGVVRDAWVPSAGAADTRHPVSVAPGDGTRLATTLTPTRRGDRLAGPVTIRSVGPLGVAGRQASIPLAGRLRVLPEFASRKHLPSRLARLRELDGRAAVQVRGEGTEFDSLRDYVVGDDVRSIDWRATARRSAVVVRTWRPERDRRVLVVLDTSRSSAARVGDQPRLDAGIEATLLLSALAAHAGDRVEVVAFDRTQRARVRGASGTRLLPAVAEALAPVAPVLVEADWTALAATVHGALSQRAFVVLVTAIDPAVVSAGLMPVLGGLAARHQVLVAAVSDPELAALGADLATGDDAYDAAAAARTDLERTAVAGLLRRTGAEVVEALPDDLAPRVADTYIALKAAGRL